MKILNPIFYKFHKKDPWKGTRIIITKKLPYLAGKQCYITKVIGTNRVEANVNMGDAVSTLVLSPGEFFLEYPENHERLFLNNTNEKTKSNRKGVRIMRKAPGLFWWTFYVIIASILWALAALVWHVVNNIDAITYTVVHGFILRK